MPSPCSRARQTIATIASQMERAGLPVAVIRDEIRSFHDEVQREMSRRAGSRNHGGDAA
jgi:hypothetical protein